MDATRKPIQFRCGHAVTPADNGGVGFHSANDRLLAGLAQCPVCYYHPDSVDARRRKAEFILGKRDTL